MDKMNGLAYDAWKTSPPEEQECECPVCGSTTQEVIYRTRKDKKIIGCDDCIQQLDFYELYLEDEERKQAAEDMKLDESRGK